MKNFPTGRNLDSLVKKVAFDALLTGVEGILPDIIDNTPIKTGTMRRSQIVSPHRAKMIVSVSANTPYAYSVHEGSNPHDIVPRKAKALAFVPVAAMRITDRKPMYLSKTGRLVVSKKRAATRFAKKVHHPGYKGNPWMRNTVKKNLNKVGRYVTAQVTSSFPEGLK